MEVLQHRQGTLKLQVYSDRRAAGEAAAWAAAEVLKERELEVETIPVIFATGESQLEMLRALIAIPDLPWEKVCGFHLDEYVGLDEEHPASFRRYLRENLTRRVPIGEFFEIDGNSSEPEVTLQRYVQMLRNAVPQLCLLGIGENGHLAFNDPAEADFHDPEGMKIVTLDAECRQQQLAEGWFERLQDIPSQAMTLTLPTILQVPKLIVSVPGLRKAHIMRRVLTEPLSTACPATILRTHPDATIYLDEESASELGGLL